MLAKLVQHVTSTSAVIGCLGLGDTSVGDNV